MRESGGTWWCEGDCAGAVVREGRHLEDAVVMPLGCALHLLRLRARCALALRRVVVHPIHGASKPAGEHVAELAFLARLREHERRVAKFDPGVRTRGVRFQDRKQAPAALRQPLQVMLEYRHPLHAMQLRFLVAPVVSGLVAGLVEDLGIRFDAERFLDRDVVVREEVTRHVQHRQRVGGPDAGIGIDVDRQLRLHRGDSVRKVAAQLSAQARHRPRARAACAGTSRFFYVETRVAGSAGVAPTRPPRP